MNRQTEQRPMPINPEAMEGKIRAFFMTVAQTIEVFLHTDRGEESILSLGLGGFVLMFLFCALFPNDDPHPMFTFMVWSVFLSMVHRIAGLWRRWRGHEQPHTRYTGVPLAARVLPWNELTIKRLEPPMVILAGCAIAFLNRPLGIWLMIAGVAQYVVVSDCVRAERRRVLDMHNSVIEQTNRAEDFRRMRR